MLRKIGSIVAFFPAIALGLELSFAASVDRTEVAMGGEIVLTVSVQGENISNIPSPDLPELADFNILSRSSSQSTNIQFINGKMSQQRSINFAYAITPRRSGKCTIGPCKLDYKGSTYETVPIEIDVTEGPVQKTPAPSSRPVPSAPGVPVKENLMLVASASRQSVYSGEELIVEFTLYNRLRISDVNLAEMPVFNGFWVKAIYDAKRIDFRRKSVDGRACDVCVLKKSVVFPLSSGELEISPMKLNVAVAKQSRDFFGFLGSTKTVTVESEPLTIHVKPLPSDNRPDEFIGAVGQFTVESSLDRSTSQAAEPVNLTIRMEGRGNIPLIERPVVPEVLGLRILDPEIEEDFRIEGNRLKGHKEFRYPVIPQADGQHIIPSVKIAYFDPKDKSYHTIETGELRFTASQTAAATEFVPTGGLKVLGSDINYVKPDLTVLKSQSINSEWWLVFFYLASFGLVGFALLFDRHRTRLLKDRAYARRLRSNRLVKKRMKEAELCLKKGNEKEFYAVLSNAALGYLGDRYDWDIHAMTKDELRLELAKVKIGAETTEKVIELLHQCDIARFSPSLMTIRKPERLLVEMKKVLSEL